MAPSACSASAPLAVIVTVAPSAKPSSSMPRMDFALALRALELNQMEDCKAVASVTILAATRR